jgi:hypothetical protein
MLRSFSYAIVMFLRVEKSYEYTTGVHDAYTPFVFRVFIFPFRSQPQVIRLAGILSAKLKLLESNDNSLFILRRSWFAVLSKACKLLNMDYCPKKTQEKFERKKMPEKSVDNLSYEFITILLSLLVITNLFACFRTSDVTNTVAFKVSEKASIVLPAETSDLTSARQNAH